MNCDALCALTQAANQPYRAADIIDDSVCVSKKRVACENFPQSAIIQAFIGQRLCFVGCTLPCFLLSSW